MKQKFSLWATEARVLQLAPEDLKDYHITVRSEWEEDNKDYAKYGYVWLSNHEQEVVLPRLKDRIASITAGVEERIQQVNAQAFKEVKELQEQLQNLLALSYEAEGGDNVLDA